MISNIKDIEYQRYRISKISNINDIAYQRYRISKISNIKDIEYRFEIHIIAQV